jgi:hypothetical protein
MGQLVPLTNGTTRCRRRPTAPPRLHPRRHRRRRGLPLPLPLLRLLRLLAVVIRLLRGTARNSSRRRLNLHDDSNRLPRRRYTRVAFLMFSQLDWSEAGVDLAGVVGVVEGTMGKQSEEGGELAGVAAERGCPRGFPSPPRAVRGRTQTTRKSRRGRRRGNEPPPPVRRVVCIFE